MSSASNPYPLPLYLNQKYVFDVLAMMEGGFSQVETVKSSHSEQGEKSARFSGDIGVKNAFAFLGISLGGERTGKQQSSDTAEASRERVHTPNSLFSRMREQLHSSQLVRSADLKLCEPGEFVEFSLALRKNPLIDTLEVMKSLITTGMAFEQPQTPRGQRKTAGDTQSSKKLLEQLDAVVLQLNQGQTVDLIGRNAGVPDLSVLLTLDRAFLSDPSMFDLVDGEYVMLGKVTRVIPEGTDGRINLLRKSGLGRIQGEMLEQWQIALKGLEETGFLDQQLVTEIGAPAIQVIPIALFA